jgi:uncharacterized protein YjdB
MATSSPIGMDTDTANVPDGEDSMENYADEMSGEAGSSGLEGSEAKRAKAQAIALSKAAETARARYARLASPSAGLGAWDVQSGLQADGASDSVAAHGSRVGGIETALAATTVVDQLQTSFPAVTANPVVKAGLPWAPLLLLKPSKRGSGFGAVVSDPRVWSAVAVAGLAIASETMKKTKNITGVRITRFERELDAGSTHKFLADAFDDGGKGAPAQNMNFASSDPAVAQVDSTGVVKALKAGKATITATMDGHSDLVTIKVT